MAIILNIETSTKNCSVSLSKEGQVLYSKELNTGSYSHAEMLHPLIDECVKEMNLSYSELSAVCVGKGPGSYTGLRIGVSTAKGLCFANNTSLIAINSLEILARACSIEEGTIIPLIDARRMEVYSAVFSHNYNWIRETNAEIVDENSFKEYLDKGPVYFLGDGAEKCKTIITHKNANFLEDLFPSAIQMGNLSATKYKSSNFEDVAYFEPYYLKDFVVTPQKKK